jgi:hypothetical protein
MKHWLGFVMDGRIRAIDEGSSSQYVDEIPVPWLGFENGELVIKGHRGNEWVKVGHFLLKSEAASRSRPSA